MARNGVAAARTGGHRLRCRHRGHHHRRGRHALAEVACSPGRLAGIRRRRWPDRLVLASVHRQAIAMITLGACCWPAGTASWRSRWRLRHPGTAGIASPPWAHGLLAEQINPRSGQAGHLQRGTALGAPPVSAPGGAAPAPARRRANGACADNPAGVPANERASSAAAPRRGICTAGARCRSTTSAPAPAGDSRLPGRWPYGGDGQRCRGG